MTKTIRKKTLLSQFHLSYLFQVIYAANIARGAVVKIGKR